ncbi:MAG TPA: alkaline phosphatase family protein [Actinomycetota bacterium]|jgi:predicted AlkP superfamily phosphohydrolase/phosphomutase|nr:alkaline phosphatase family protein [Actinomycetota bacterium]
MGLFDKIKKKGGGEPRRKVMVIGLDCAPPEHIFDEYADEVPTLTKLKENGLWGPLESITPPITVPAWMCMMTSKDPGTLGIYGFRNRKDHTYEGLEFATSLKVKEPAVWDILSENGKTSIVMSVPPSYPPKPLNGVQVGCFLTPTNESEYTYPKELKPELLENAGEYIFDVRNFRTDNTQYIIDESYKMTEAKFRNADYLLSNKPWDFFMIVEMGPDRLNHGIWSFVDPNHPRYEPDNPFRHALRDYYRFLDGKISDLLAKHADDDTTVLVVSDHGAKAMVGGVCFNEWLVGEGLLAFEGDLPDEVTPINKLKIDWSKTTAWGDGGYYGRLFLNVAGREPNGIVPRERYEEVRDDLIRRIEAMVDHEGNPMGNKALKPEDLYENVNGVAPDLIVIFGALRWRSVGSLGHGSIYTFENDTGPDEANHAEHGIFIMSGAPGQPTGRRDGLHLWDVHTTILDLFDLPPAEGARGRSALKS